MKIKKGFMLKKMGNMNIVVPVGESAKTFSGVITLNGSGAFLFERLKDGETTDGLVKALLSQYDIDEETAKRDTLIFLNTLTTAGILEDENVD